MKRLSFTLPFVALLLAPAGVGAQSDPQMDADGVRWWRHVQAFANDGMADNKGEAPSSADAACCLNKPNRP